jgi:hypothetical protein
MMQVVRPTNDPKTVTVQLRVSADYLKAVDDWRRLQDDIPVRSEAIRRLTMMALASPSTARPKTKK